MSVKGLVLHFRRDLDDHEAEQMIDALMIHKGITKVSPVEAGYEDHLNRQRVKRELLDKMRASGRRIDEELHADEPASEGVCAGVVTEAAEACNRPPPLHCGEECLAAGGIQGSNVRPRRNAKESLVGA